MKRCRTWCYLDEFFGDCCHPDSGGAIDIAPSLNNCGKSHNYAWWKEKKTKPLSHISDECIEVERKNKKL